MLKPVTSRLARVAGAVAHHPFWSWCARLRLLGLALALATAGYAQSLADARLYTTRALALYLVAALLYVLSTWEKPVPVNAPTSHAGLHVRVQPLLAAAVCAVLAFLSLHENHFTLHGLLLWIAAMALCFCGLRGQSAPRQGQRRARLAGPWHISWSGLALLGAIVVGAWFRLYRLLELPADLGWDLPYNYIDVKSILNGEYLVFFPANMGREGMFFYLAAAVARLGSLSAYSIRITSALVGIATLPAVYLLAKECANREVGLYATWLLALNKWHIVLTRSGYRVSLMPLFSILALYGLARGLRRGRARDWCWCGLFTGLGLWTYKAFTFMLPVVIGVLVLYALLSLRKRGAAAPDGQTYWAPSPRTLLCGGAIWLLVMIVCAVPMLRFAVDSPETYLTREQLGLNLVSESAGGLSRWQMLRENSVTSLLMFNYTGDGNSRFGVPFQRHLGYIGGILFVFGLAAALATPRRRGHALLIVSLLGLLVPMTVSMLAKEMPNCFRSSGTIGPVVVLGALVLQRVRELLAQWVSHIRPRTLVLSLHAEDAALRAEDAAQTHSVRLRLGAHLGWLVTLAIVLFLVGESRETERFYFTDFRRWAPDVANYSVALEISKTIIAYEDGAVYVKAWPYWYDGRALTEHLDAVGRSWTAELQDLKLDQTPLAELQGKALFVLHPDDVESLQTLEGFFPRHAYTTAHYPDGTASYIAFYGEK